MWQTPHGFANTDASGKTAGASDEFGKQVKQWYTPAASDGSGGPGGIHTGEPKANLRTQAAGRLNPRFVEWLMGMPDEWTNGIPRADRLRALGNGVVPAQAALALRLLIEQPED